MNILFHGWEYPPNGGGVGVYMHNMTRALSDAGHHVVMVTGRADGLPEEEEQNGVCIYRKYEKRETGNRRVHDMVLSIAREHSIDWIEGADHLGDCAGLLRVKDRPPVIIKIHTCNVLKALCESQVLYAWQRFFIQCAIWRNRRQYLAEKYCIEHADILLAPTKRVIHELRKQGLRITQAVDIIPNVLVETPASMKTEAQKPTVLFVGRLDIGKGIQYLPEIMRSLKRRDVRLEMAGPDTYARGIGSLKEWLQKQFEGCDYEVRFLGKLDSASLAEAYKKAWVVIVPSRWDNFPSVILEAMAYRKPVVASPIGGIPEMLDGTKSCIADPVSPEFADALRAFVENKLLREEVGTSMRQKLDSVYSADHIVGQYIDRIQKRLACR